MKRIIIIGCPGSGKSTLSRELHNITDIPLFHLDMMYWNSNKTTVEKSIFLERLSEALQKSEWIIDGNYNSTMELRLQKCDTVIFLDYPLEVCLNGIIERRGKAHSDIPWVSNDEDDAELIQFAKSYISQSRPMIMELLDRYSNKDIYIFKSRAETNEFLYKCALVCRKGKMKLVQSEKISSKLKKVCTYVPYEALTSVYLVRTYIPFSLGMKKIILSGREKDNRPNCQRLPLKARTDFYFCGKLEN